MYAVCRYTYTIHRNIYQSYSILHDCNRVNKILAFCKGERGGWGGLIKLSRVIFQTIFYTVAIILCAVLIYSTLLILLLWETKKPERFVHIARIASAIVLYLPPFLRLNFSSAKFNYLSTFLKRLIFGNKYLLVYKVSIGTCYRTIIRLALV